MINDRYIITQLIPQRSPMLLVDRLVEADGKTCTTQYTIKEDCALSHGGKLTEAGVIEHMAQSASALAGYHALEHGAENPPLGMIGEVKNLKLFCPPRYGQTLTTKICMDLTVGNISNVWACTSIGEKEIASAIFKIVIN